MYCSRATDTIANYTFVSSIGASIMWRVYIWQHLSRHVSARDATAQNILAVGLLNLLLASTHLCPRVFSTGDNRVWSILTHLGVLPVVDPTILLQDTENDKYRGNSYVRKRVVIALFLSQSNRWSAAFSQ